MLRMGGRAYFYWPSDALVPASEGHCAGRTPATSKVHVPIDRTMILLAIAFACAWTVTAAMAAHFPRIMEAAGVTSMEAIAAGA